MGCAVGFKTCKKAFVSIGLKYLPEKYACYNEDVAYKELCPFAKNDTCTSDELPKVSKTLESLAPTGLRRVTWEGKLHRGSAYVPVGRTPIQNIL